MWHLPCCSNLDAALAPNRITNNMMIDGHIKGGDLEAGYGLRDQMLHHGPKLNVITYNLLLSGLCHAGRMDETRALMDEMASYGLLPDGFTYNILFNGLIRMGDSHIA
jgi:pentatricopeptide repeat protein